MGSKKNWLPAAQKPETYDDCRVQPEAAQVTASEPADTEHVQDPPAVATEPKETKRERFLRLVDQRMPKVVARLGAIRALGNKSNYDPDPATVADIDRVLLSHIEAIRTALAGSTRTSGGWR